MKVVGLHSKRCKPPPVRLRTAHSGLSLGAVVFLPVRVFSARRRTLTAASQESSASEWLSITACCAPQVQITDSGFVLLALLHFSWKTLQEGGAGGERLISSLKVLQASEAVL